MSNWTSLAKEMPLVSSSAPPKSTLVLPLYQASKRGFDFSLALIALVLLCPLLLMVALSLLVSSGGPIFYRHKRIGSGGRTFSCLKFRTMKLDGDLILRRHLEEDEQARAEWQKKRKLQNDPRVTRVGAVLRKASLDELPQLLNILIGDMSFVGPRPIVEEEIGYYGANIDRYMIVRPGLTGPWQISGRSDVSFSARVRLDCEYVEKSNLFGDIVILAKTIPAVLSARGSY